MAEPVFVTYEGESPFGRVTVVSFEIPGGVSSPEEFAEATARLSGAGASGVILSGRGPIWGYGMLIHRFHPTPWVAVHDPRLGAAVVVQTHSVAAKVGQRVPVPEAPHA